MRALLLLLAIATTAQAQYTEPQRGTQLRKDLMSAIRPIMEWHLGPPVQFVIHDLRVAGDVAFASVHAQRPGGGKIDLYKTPGYRRGQVDPEHFDDTSFQALYQKSGTQWVPVQHVIGATDVWWAWDEFCPIWRAVIPEVC